MHKAGSSFAGDVLKTLFSASGFHVSDPGATAFAAGLDEVEYVHLVVDSLAAPGIFSGPHRVAFELIGRRQDIRQIVYIRDPRDCLVSMYYSLAFSHVVPPPGRLWQKFLNDRDFARSTTIDEYVLAKLPDACRALDAIRAAVGARPGTVISCYETMVMDFGNWIAGLIKEVGLDVPDETTARLVGAIDFKVEENALNHKRQVAPGDFRRKLSGRTQNALTEQLGDLLQYFGYYNRPGAISFTDGQCI
jgi:hypothetical protein